MEALARFGERAFLAYTESESMMGRILLFLVALGAVAVLVVLWPEGEEGSGSSSPLAPGSVESDDKAPPTGAEDRERVVQEKQADSAADKAASPVRKGSQDAKRDFFETQAESTWSFEVVRKGEWSSVEGATLAVQAYYLDQEAYQDWLEARLDPDNLSAPEREAWSGSRNPPATTTDAQGLAELKLPAGIRFHLWVLTEDRDIATHGQILPALQASEVRALKIELRHQADRSLEILVRDEAGGAIRAAQLTLMEDDQTPLRFVTNHEGSLELMVRSWAHPRLHLDHSDFAAREINLRPALEEGASHPYPVVLYAASGITGKVTDRSGTPLAGVRVRAALERDYYHPPDHPRAFMGASATTGEDGHYSLQAVPPRIALRLHVRDTQARYPDLRSSLRLDPGQERIQNFVMSAGVLVRGRVQRADGSPLAQTPILLARASHAVSELGNGQLIPISDSIDDYIRARTTSDAEGRFQFEAVPAGAWVVGLRNYPRELETLFHKYSPELITSIGSVVQLDGAEREVEVLLPATNGLTIAGRLVHPEGEPIEGAYVGVFSIQGLGGLITACDKDGSFVIGPLLAGEYRSFVMGPWEREKPQHWCNPAVQTVSAGTQDLRLPIRRVERLCGRIVDNREHPTRAEVEIQSIDDTEFRQFRQTEEDGRFCFESLPPGSYTVRARTADGRCVVHGPWRTRAEPEEQVLALTPYPGGELELWLDSGDVEALRRHGFLVFAADTLVASHTVTANDNRWQLRLPEGEYRVVLHRDDEQRVVFEETLRIDPDRPQSRRIPLAE